MNCLGQFDVLASILNPRHMSLSKGYSAHCIDKYNNVIAILLLLPAVTQVMLQQSKNILPRSPVQSV